jgi:hypothetical protein
VLLLQTPFVPAGPLVQSALVQQAAIGTHRVVFGQFLKPLLHATPHWEPSHAATPFALGSAQT